MSVPLKAAQALSQLPNTEAMILQDIERQTGKKFLLFSHISGDPRMSFSVENGHVTELGLKDCGLSTLPENLGLLCFLEKLSLESNQLKSLPKSIGQLTRLRFLNVNNNQIFTLPESIGQLTLLEILYLDRNKLISLPESIGQLLKLKSFDLAGNNLTSIPETIGNLGVLRALTLVDNKLNSLPESIWKLGSLEILSLHYNQLSSLTIKNNVPPSLRTLSLSDNKFTQLPDSIGNLVHLYELSLKRNQLTSLPNALGNLANLRDLDLSENRLTTLPNTIGSLKCLENLNLADNQLTSLPESISQLTSLRTLNLYKNQLVSLPQSIVELNSLKELQIELSQIPTEFEPQKLWIRDLKKTWRQIVKNTRVKEHEKLVRQRIAFQAQREKRKVETILPFYHEKIIETLQFSKDGTYLISVSESQEIIIWDFQKGAPLCFIKSSGDAISCTTLSPNNKYIATATDDCEDNIFIWDFKTGKRIHRLLGHSEVNALCFTPDEKFLISGGSNPVLKVWDVGTGLLVKELDKDRNLDPQEVALTIVLFPRRNSFFSTYAIDSNIKEFSLSTWEYNRYFGKNDSPSLLVATPDEKFLLGYLMIERELKKWDVNTGNEVLVFEPPPCSIKHMEVSFFGNILYALLDNGTIYIWDLRSGRIIRTMDSIPRIDAMTLAPGGKSYVISRFIEEKNQKGSIMEIRDIETGSVTRLWGKRDSKF